jgi:hypothetical protein
MSAMHEPVVLRSRLLQWMLRVAAFVFSPVFVIAAIVGPRGADSSVVDRVGMAAIAVATIAGFIRGTRMRWEGTDSGLVVYHWFRTDRLVWADIQSVVQASPRSPLRITTVNGCVVKVESPGPSRWPTRRWRDASRGYLELLRSALDDHRAAHP